MTQPKLTTPERLAKALEDAIAPSWMVAKARQGGYDDFKSESATPIGDLVRDAQANGLRDIRRRAEAGEFDATVEEADAWAASEDGQETFRKLLNQP